eukprot:scaffold1156_cov48-Cyclotella_meneghiniana.AAC.2
MFTSILILGDCCVFIRITADITTSLSHAIPPEIQVVKVVLREVTWFHIDSAQGGDTNERYVRRRGGGDDDAEAGVVDHRPLQLHSSCSIALTLQQTAGAVRTAAAAIHKDGIMVLHEVKRALVKTADWCHGRIGDNQKVSDGSTKRQKKVRGGWMKPPKVRRDAFLCFSLFM